MVDQAPAAPVAPSRLRRFAVGALRIAVIVAVACAVGFGIERCRSSRLAAWAAREGGTFSAAEVAVPEAADFDAGAEPGSIAYWNVARIEREGVVYVLAHYYRSWNDIHGRQQSVGHDVCYVVVPGPPFPPLRVSDPRLFRGQGQDPPDAVQGFGERFRVYSKADPVPADALSRLLPPAVQKELIENEDVISELSARGRVLRLDAVKSYTMPPYERLFGSAERCAAIWRR